MRKIVLFFTLIAATAPLASACDRSDPSTTSIGGGANALVDDEAEADTAGDTAPEDPASPGDDPEPSPIEVAWTDGADGADSAVDELRFDLRNVSDGSVSGTVRLLCSSVLDRSAALDLGAFDIAPGEVQAYSIAASDLPIRSSSVLTQAMVEISRTYTKPGDVEGAVVAVEAPRFYRHSPGYDELRAYTGRQVRDDLGGTLFTAPSAFASDSTPSEAAAEESVLGQVKNTDGGFDDVTMASQGIALRDDDGSIYAYVTGARFGVAEPPEIDAAAAEEVTYE